MGQLIALALATFASEDLACIAAGTLIGNGQLAFLPGVLACATGIYLGDLLLYFVGRFAGAPLVRRFASQARLDAVAQWMNTRGPEVVLLSRFTPGLRLPTYLAAGMLRVPFWRFNTYLAVAALLWTPILVGGAAWLGRAIEGAPLVLALFLLVWQQRARIATFVRRARWEFWPPWLAYLPVLPYLFYLAVKHRSLTLFTAANPGIPSGGFAGESKSAILDFLPHVPEFRVVRAGASTEIPEFPIVLKPDIGERGCDVAIVRTPQEAHQYLANAQGDTIVQRYVSGIEFGVFYYRYPGESRGRISSITEKRFPEVVGDGDSTLRDLITRDRRATLLARLYLSSHTPDRIPAAGERVRLVEVGSHCRGAIFLDGSRYCTEALEASVDAAAKSHPGFYFGRFDIRAASLDEFRAGRFQILELNGVSAEPTHIYDPAIPLLEAYRVMWRHWRAAFEIGSANRTRGKHPMRLREFVQLVCSRVRPRSSQANPTVGCDRASRALCLFD